MREKQRLKAQQKEADAIIQAKIDAEVAKRTAGLAVKPSPSSASPKPKTGPVAFAQLEDMVPCTRS